MSGLSKRKQRRQNSGVAGWRANIKWFGRQQDGATALEFALVAPLVFLVLFAGIELGIMVMADSALERTAANISRMERVVGFNEGRDCAHVVRDELQRSLQGWVSHNIEVSVEAVYHPAEPISDPADPAYVAFCQEAGGQSVGPGSLAVFRISFQDPVFIGALGALGVKPLQRFERVLVVQNEP